MSTLLPFVRAIDANDDPMSGAKLEFLLSGTSTSVSTYTTSALTTANSNPVVADSSGVFPAIYLDPTTSYRVRFKTSANVVIADFDPISVSSFAGEVSVKAFGAIGDGSADDSNAVGAARAFAVANGLALYFPTGTYKITSAAALLYRIGNYLPYIGNAFAPAPRIRGDGVGRTILDSRVASGFLIDIDSDNPHDEDFQAVLDGCVSDLSITNLVATTSSSAIKLRTTFCFRMENLHIAGLSGTGIRVICSEGDLDGCNEILVKNSRIENCGGWGIDVGDPNHAESSFVKLDQAIIQNCGTAAEKAIIGITKADPAVVTATGHGFANGDKVYIGGVEGMTQVNSYTAEAQYTVAGKTDDTFQLSGINSSGFGTFVGTATISGVTKANPAVVTATAHGLADGAHITITGVGGMTELNGNRYVIDFINANSFALRDVDSRDFGTYTSPGTATVNAVVFPAVPASGGMKWKGQILEIQSSGWALNRNCSLYINGLGGGLPQDVRIQASTIENPCLVGALVSGVFNLSVDEMHVYNGVPSNGGTPNFWGWLFDGTGNVIKNVELSKSCVRARSNDPASYTAFQIFGANAEKHSIRIRGTSWKEFYDFQTRFRGVQFDPIPQHCKLAVVSGTQVVLRPDPDNGEGNKMPIRTRNAIVNAGLSSDGEWVVYDVGAAGILLTNSGLTGGPQTYHVYLYAADAVVLTAALEASTTAPVQDPANGYMVKTGDATRLWVGRVRTTASNEFEVGTTTLGFQWLNPMPVPGYSVGTDSLWWFNNADRSFYYKNGISLPSFGGGGDYRFPAVFGDFTATYDPPSIASLGVATTTITATGLVVGDYVIGLSFSPGLGGLMMTGEVTATNTITVTLFNPTGSAIDRGSGLLRAIAIRR